MKYLFKKNEFTGRFFFDDKIIPMECSSFGESILEIICQDESFEELKTKLSRLPVIDDVKLDSLSIGYEPHCSFDDVVKILPFLKMNANMKNPKIKLFLTRTRDGWFFGREVSVSHKMWSEHKKKKLTVSSAVPQLMSRTLVEVLKYSGSNSFIDYCCGSGTFTLDASSLGMACTAIDLNEKFVDMTRKNLQQFGYSAELKVANAINFSKCADSAVVDFPYGYHCVRDEEEEKLIIENVMQYVKLAFFIVGKKSHELFNKYDIIEYFSIPAVNVTRHIYLCRNKNGS